MAELQDLLDVLVEIREDVRRGRLPTNTKAAHTDCQGQATHRPFHELVVDCQARVVRWRGRELGINSGADFVVLAALRVKPDTLVPYATLLRQINPEALSPAVESLSAAPQEARDAVQHINSALRHAGCPLRVISARRLGYRLTDADE